MLLCVSRSVEGIRVGVLVIIKSLIDAQANEDSIMKPSVARRNSSDQGSQLCAPAAVANDGACA
jgi:hypothetical protein